MTQSKPILSQYGFVLIPTCLLFLLGGFIASSLPLHKVFWLTWSAIALLSTILVVWFRQPALQVKWFVWLFALFLGGSIASHFSFQPKHNDVYYRASSVKIELDGVIEAPWKDENQWVLSVQKANHQTVSGKVIFKVTSNPTPKLQIGESIHAKGILSEPFKASFPGDFDYADYLHQHQISATFKTHEVEITDTTPKIPWHHILRTAAHLQARFTNHCIQALGKTHGAVLASIVLGEHAVGLEEDLKQDFIQSGLIHVLSASGFNVGLIAAFFLFCGAKLKLPWRVNILLALMGIGLYCLLTGMPPSVQRAGLMLGIALVLKLMKRELSSVLLLCLSGVILFLLNPNIVTVLGFQLSFISTFGLLTMVNPLEEKLSFYMPNWLAGLILIPLVAQLWVTPFLVHTFHSIQILSIPANLIAVPLVAILTFLGFILGALSFLIPSITAILMKAALPILMGLEWIANTFGNAPLAITTVGKLPLTSEIAFMIVLLGAATWCQIPSLLPNKKWITLGLVALLFWLTPISLTRFKTQSDVTAAWLPAAFPNQYPKQVVMTQPGYAWVIVADLSYYDARSLYSYLRNNGVHTLQFIHLINPNTPHGDGLAWLANHFKIEAIGWGQLNKPQAKNELLETAEKEHIQLNPLQSTQQLYAGKQKALTYNAGNSYQAEVLYTGHNCVLTQYQANESTTLPRAEAFKNCVQVSFISENNLAIITLPKQQPQALQHFKEIKL